MRARSSVVAAESFGICTFLPMIPVDELLFDEESIEEERFIFAESPSNGEADERELAVILDVPCVVSKVDARGEGTPFCRDIPQN